MGVRLRVWASLLTLLLVPVGTLLVLCALAATVLLGYENAGIGPQALAPAFLLGLVGLVVLHGLPGRRPVPRPEGLEILPEEEPGLWGEIEDICEVLGEDPPDHLVIDGRPRTAVTEQHDLREMVIGLPLLVGLSRVELRSLMTHEMAHFAHGTTRGTWFVLRAQYWLRSTVGTLRRSPLRRLITLYLKLYSAVSGPARAHHELGADIWAGRLAGPEVAAQALRQRQFVDEAWRRVLEQYGRALVPRGPRASLAEALTELMHDSRELVETEAHRRLFGMSQYDAHPPDEERIATLRSLRFHDRPRLPLEHPHEPAWTWLNDAPGLFDEVEIDAVAPDPDERFSSWATVLTRQLVKDSREKAGDLLDALHRMNPGSPPTLDGLLRAVASGRAQRLTDDLPGSLRAAVIVALAQERRVRAEPDFSPGGPLRITLVTRDGQTWDWPFDEVIADAVRDPRELETLAQALESADVDLREPVEA
ncbi:M48 family metallopeptidase [Kineosporia succinea]|uniref:Peptidase M48 domain-containing protein n=1 Tax=Kineosporia succinea TaxID=84632 RepID=A0ABT9NWP3_9ACTN|nr:M48 family metallopeptidase [Kineosporia succinea]MDP9824848.1 hypothetical protein [Kineosporia succinea]